MIKNDTNVSMDQVRAEKVVSKREEFKKMETEDELIESRKVAKDVMAVMETDEMKAEKMSKFR